MPGPRRLERHGEEEWLALVEGHLALGKGIGVYPYNHDHDGVVWGCVDFDDGELASWSHANDLYEGLHELGVGGFIERSRSKGYHVWTFASDWTPAHVMRRLLVGTCVAVGVPHKEVNPKSEKLLPGQLGNFVRLPYPGVGSLASTPTIDRQVVVDLLGHPLSVMLFVQMALESARRPEELARIARSLDVPREAPQGRLRAIRGPWQDQLNGLAKKQLAEGPKPGGDRSSYLAAFGWACRESGLGEDDIARAVRVADYVHGQKYTNRKDAEARYADIAHRSLTPSDG